MYVCMCEAVTDHAIHQAIDEGASTVAEVMACTRAGTRCGACRSEIAAIVASAVPPKSCRRLHVVGDRQPDAAEPQDKPAEAA